MKSTENSGTGVPTVAIVSVSATQTTVNDGGTFDVTWNVSHSNNAGEVVEMGLYLGAAADLMTASARDARVFFVEAATPGSGLVDPSQSSITCTRTGLSVRCGSQPGTTSRMISTGAAVETTFRACNSFVLDATSEVCDMRSIQMTFP